MEQCIRRTSIIIIDSREFQEILNHRNITSLEELSSLMGIPITVDTLDAADFAFLNRDDNPVGIERCEINNLLQKLRSGELEQQLTKCDAYYSTIILLVEGVYDHVSGFLSTYKRGDRTYYRNRIYPNTRYTDIKALEVRLSELGIEIIETPNFDCSIRTIQTIYHQRTKLEEEHSLFKKLRPVRIPVKLSSDPVVPKLLALGKRLPEKTAIRLVHKYGSIWNIIHTSDEDLLQIEGMGKTLLRNLKQSIGKPDE